jgi:hypothetical protein
MERYGIEIAVDRAEVVKVRAALRQRVQPRARRNFRERSSQQDHCILPSEAPGRGRQSSASGPYLRPLFLWLFISFTY